MRKDPNKFHKYLNDLVDAGRITSAERHEIMRQAAKEFFSGINVSCILKNK